jgi:hypothetical protein
MDIALTLSREELVQALSDFLPMRLLFGKIEGNSDPAWLQIDQLETVSFFPARALGMTCAARVHYPLPILPDTFVVQHVSIEMVPSIIDGPVGKVLAFELHVADLDLKFVPSFIDRTICDKINTALREHASVIAWDFEHTLSRVVRLPQRMSLVTDLTLTEPTAEVWVGDDGMTVRMNVAVGFLHDGLARRDAPAIEAVVEVAPDERAYQAS